MLCVSNVSFGKILMKLISIYLFSRLFLRFFHLKTSRFIELLDFSFIRFLLFTPLERKIYLQRNEVSFCEDMQISLIIVHAEISRFDFLIEALRSVDRQIIKPLEIIVVSKYEMSFALVSKLNEVVACDVRYFYNSHPSEARNFGVAESKGDIVCFLDDDNILLPWHLSFIKSTFQKYPEIDIVFGSYLHFKGNNISYFPIRYRVNSETIVFGDPTDPSSLGVKRLHAIKNRWDETTLSENWIYLLDQFSSNSKIFQLYVPLSLHRSHRTSRSSTISVSHVPRIFLGIYRPTYIHFEWSPTSHYRQKLMRIWACLRTSTGHQPPQT